MELSILDFNHAGTAIDLMTEADRLGFQRYWLGEHHSEWQCANPLLLGALLAATSGGIRLGSGGVCLKYHSPYRIAEDARLIEFMLPGRFDLGVTRGVTLSPELLDALMDGRSGEGFRDHYDKLADLHAYLTGRVPEGHPLSGQRMHMESGPPMWVLGINRETARWAARHGTGFCFSMHHAPPDFDGAGLLEEYRRHFVPSPEFPEPKALVVVSILCAGTDEEVRELERAYEEMAAEGQKQGAVLARPRLQGTTGQCIERLEELAHRHQVSEVMLLDLLPWEPKGRLNMFRMLADAAGLTPRSTDPSPGGQES